MRLCKDLSRELYTRMAADVLLIQVALVSAALFDVLATLWFSNSSLDSQMFKRLVANAILAYLYSSPGLALALAIFMARVGIYGRVRTYPRGYKALTILRVVTSAYLLDAAVGYMLRGYIPYLSRGTWLGAWFLTSVMLIGSRFWADLWRATIWAEVSIFGRPAIRTMRNIVVIGGAGYVGSVLVRRLLNKGYRVTVLDNLLYGDGGIHQLYGHERFELLRGDLRNIRDTVSALQFADGVVHLGAVVGDPACSINEPTTLEVNLAATAMIAYAARALHVQRLVFASTCSVYGASDQILDEHSALNPVSLYARTKIDAEKILLEVGDHDCVTTILRFATLFGMSPRPRFDLVVNLFAAQAVQDKQIIVSGGNQWRPFVHVADAAEAILMCLEAPEAAVKTEIFNVGSDSQNYSIERLGQLIREIDPSVVVYRRGQDVDIRNYRVTFAKIRSRLGFIPKYSLREGIEEIMAASRSGTVDDYQSISYSNYMSLQMDGASHLTKHGHLRLLYTDRSGSD